MRKLIKKIKTSAIVKNDRKNFLHFFLAFTVIFVALTLIILQVMRSGTYKATDQNLRDLSQNTTFLTSTAQHQQITGNGMPQTQGGDFGPTNTLLVYNSEGKNLLPVTNSESSNIVLAQLQKKMKLNKDNIDKIESVIIHNPYGENWHFRYLTSEVNMENEVTGVHTTAYVQIFSNVDQLQDSLASNVRIIITTMAIFWLLSIILSLYLANWTLRPIVAAFEKQKEFVENASHELRTPLAILQNRLELLFQNPTSTIIDESENISESLSEVRNMRLLTTNLLNLARRDNGINIAPVDTDASYFEGIFSNYKMLAENADKTFTGTVKFDGTAQLDQSLIKQLLTILFDNALKYTDDDGAVTIDIVKNNKELTFTVADNGDGISDEDKKRIFDRFFRVDKARTRQKGGLGLGLSLAKQIIDAYNGKISVEDTQPKGTTFVIKLRLDSTIVNPANIFKKL
ncbi:sensor histidine kinase [Lactococcus nasutitermitis]|uniref:histidine kinase n=1 Tax=Lactococcus nasutitermitis TaxID=1652957 RepID=A0ABV9JC96_9LACT|nr:HAMP domain-containing sensor histidine kinase [Lactococcus nasutitermitis]